MPAAIRPGVAGKYCNVPVATKPPNTGVLQAITQLVVNAQSACDCTPKPSLFRMFRRASGTTNKIRSPERLHFPTAK